MKIKPFSPKIFPEHANITSARVLKFGIDPTFNRLHIGHLVPLAWLLKQQKKDVTIILGTITARLGDPSGKEKTRPILTKHEVLANADAIRIQLNKIIPWARILEQVPTDTQTLLETSSHFTVSKMMSRDGFQRRESVSTHELLVPILQAMDSVNLSAEVEIGGEDQLFNFELTREVQKIFGQKPESCLMFPIIRGSNENKMSKSVGNCIWLDDPQIKQRIMSIPDDVMDEWLPLFSDENHVPDHPKTRKEFLADCITNMLKV